MAYGQYSRCLAAGVLLLAPPVWGYWRVPCSGVVGIGRIDPIVSPGKPAGHMHTIKGGSGLAESSTLDDLLNSKCTSCKIKQDKSNYWTPQLYFQDTDGSFELVPEAVNHTTYYRYQPLSTPTGQPIVPVAIPNGMRMVSGNSLRRNFSLPVPDPPTPWTGAAAAQDALKQKAIGFTCLDYNSGEQTADVTSVHTMPEKAWLDANCANGLRLEVVFPPCWNGKDLDSADHQSHVAFASDGSNGGRCPEGFQTGIMQLLYETIYPVENYRNRNGRYVLANGDPTGSGYHGDAFIAWEPGVMQAAVDQCGQGLIGNPGYLGNPYECTAFTLQEDPEQEACQLERTSASPNAARKVKLSQLPGNNPIQSGPEQATVPAAGAGPATTSAAYAAATTLSRMPVAAPSPAAQAGTGGSTSNSTDSTQSDDNSGGSNSNASQDSSASQNGNANQNSNSNSTSNANQNSGTAQNGNASQNSNSSQKSNASQNNNSNQGNSVSQNVNTNQNGNGNQNSNSNANQNSNGNVNTSPSSNNDVNSQSTSVSNGNTNVNNQSASTSNGNGNGNINFNSNTGNTNVNSNGNANFNPSPVNSIGNMNSRMRRRHNSVSSHRSALGHSHGHQS